MKITHAIIPAAGLGTRFLPFTKSVPKELLPIMNKPAIQLIIEEGIASGITTFTIITNKEKQAIKNYLSHNNELQKLLTKNNKYSLIADVEKIISSTTFNYLYQENPLGLGHAVLMSQPLIQNNYCAILLPDEIMFGKIPALSQLIAVAQKYSASVIAVQEVPQEKVSSYGIVTIKKELEPGIFSINSLVEKPSLSDAPSRLAIIGRYILSPSIFQALETVNPGAGNEIQLTDGITKMINNGEPVIACKLNSIRHDIGNPEGWFKANEHARLIEESR